MKKTILFFAALCVLLLSLSCKGPAGPQGIAGPTGAQGPEGDTGEQGESGEPLDWSDVIEEHDINNSIYAIGVQIGSDSFIIGTGFTAHFSNAIWTNAHVVHGVDEIVTDYAYLNPKPIAIKSGTEIGGNDTHVLTIYFIHSGYDGTTASPDIGVLIIDGSFSNILKFLPKNKTTGFKIGQPIGTMGFPEEIGAFDSIMPIATFKDGTISALRPYDPASQVFSPTNNHYVQHNLDLSGGTSGSPIFDHDGNVIAINNSGTEKLVFDYISGEPQRVPTGNIGFGIRIDEAWDFVEVLSKMGFGENVVSLEKLPADFEYNPFPPNWNGETILP